MRLLFIYFYKTKGTFKEGTIIELSKKYSVEHLGKFKFKLTKRDSFQDNFYGDNIDIGAIIGENGTGKSVLINSLREGGSNNYSMAIYEQDNFFYYEAEGSIDEQLFINKTRVQYVDNIRSIYYSSIIDKSYYYQDRETLYNISDKNLLFKKYIKSSWNVFNNELLKLEQNDIIYYSEMNNMIFRKYVKSKRVSFTFIDSFFETLKEFFWESLIDNIDEIAKYMKKQGIDYSIVGDYLNNRQTRVRFKNKILLSDYKLLLSMDGIRYDIRKILFMICFEEFLEDKSKKEKLIILTYLSLLDYNNDFNNIKWLEGSTYVEAIQILEQDFNFFNSNLEYFIEVLNSYDNNVSLDIENHKKFFSENNVLLDVDTSYVPYFTYELDPPLSSGQKAILFIFARIDNAIKKINSDNITILLDEADLKLHLEWQRQFINDLVEFLKSYPDKNFYVLYATHSPMILSDITDDRIVFLKKEGDYSIDKSINEKKSTFGANIYDLYHDSFFMDKYMGEFAFNKINDVINMVNLYKIVDELNDDKEKENLKDYERIYNFDELFKSYVLYYPNEEIDSKKLYLKREDIKANIENKKEVLIAITKFIGEPLLRNKLEDDLNSMGRKKVDIDEAVETLQGLSQQKIKEKLSKYSESIQMKILKKLFASEDKS